MEEKKGDAGCSFKVSQMWFCYNLWLCSLFSQNTPLVLHRLTFLSSSKRLFICTAQIPARAQHRPPGHTPILQSSHGHTLPRIGTYSDLAKEKYTLIYSLPHIKLIRAVSRFKILQTTITTAILPPVVGLYLHGDVPFFFVSYSTGIAVFAGVMLYVASHFFRRVVGMMYLDPSQTTLKVSHLTFWGKRNDIYLPVSDVMTIGDTGDSKNEKILRLKTFSSPQTFYFSTQFGRVVDKQGFQKVFGNN